MCVRCESVWVRRESGGVRRESVCVSERRESVGDVTDR